jgi:lipopolysaccharide/colanic/teichoic acid biosynthesis glycosyltransferase
MELGRDALDRASERSSVRVWPVVKRGFDALLSAVLLLAMLPLLAAIVIAIKLDSPGPVFHRVKRVGYRGRPLYMLKFRKMHNGAQGGPLTTADDPRLTRIGALLTRTRLDELPQLWDVLRGRMSIIGPRPEDPLFVSLHPRHYDTIHSVRPGITGITQLAFADEKTILDRRDPIEDYITRILPNKIQLDILYAQTTRIGLDLRVLCWTLITVIAHRPIAVHRTTGHINTRKRSTPTQTRTRARNGVRTPSFPRALLRDSVLRTDWHWRRRPPQAATRVAERASGRGP